MKVYSTMTREKQDLKTINNNRVKLFVCGPTVYDDAHIGHGRTYISFDTIKRYLEYSGYSVFYIENITDIDDKIINRSKEIGIDSSTLAKKYEKRFIEDMHSLNVHKVNLFARATDHMDEIIDQITRLIKKGYAYETEDGVYYNIDKFEDFGKLSNRKIDELESHRDIANTEKHNPNDFVLWKKREAPEFEGEPKWDSPWGKGRPGWHIECSVMAKEVLGETIDIHGGGEDLEFPHHENEIAQSETLHGKSFANYWMHNAMITIDKAKMSKSEGNSFTIHDIEKDFDLMTVRIWLLSGHYRTPIDFSKENLEAIKNGYSRLKNSYESLERFIEHSNVEDNNVDQISIDAFISEFEKAMDDDFNTANALSALFDFSRYLNTNFSHETSLKQLKYAKEKFDIMKDILGIKFEKEFLDDDIEKLIQERQEARKNKDFQKSDEIRDLLLEKGIRLKDTSTGVVWERV